MSKDTLTYRAHYFDDPVHRTEFKRFMHMIHQLDLTVWEQYGFWDPACYTPFSIFDGARIVSTVNIFTMDLVVQGQVRRVGQISGVGTDPAYRRQGLARHLTGAALEWAARTCEGFFLFASDEAVALYQLCGFVPVREAAPVLAVTPPRSRSGLRRLYTANDEDRALIHRLARERAPVSRVLGVLTPSLLMYHCLNGMRDHIGYVAELDVLVLFRTDGRRLTLFDVVGPAVPSFEELHPYLAAYPHQEVLLQFEPDLMGVVPQVRVPQANNAHVRAPFAMPAENCVFPFVAQA
jgi:GNAT superfamily N-acetyltransferase